MLPCGATLLYDGACELLLAEGFHRFTTVLLRTRLNMCVILDISTLWMVSVHANDRLGSYEVELRCHVPSKLPARLSALIEHGRHMCTLDGKWLVITNSRVFSD